MTAHPKPSRKLRLSAEAEERSLRALKVAELRHLALERDQFRCVACGCDLEQSGVDLHHLVSGSGRRRENEELGTLASTCPGCHGQAHAGDINTLLALGRWARAHGSEQAREEIRRRLAKVETSLTAFRKVVGGAR